MRFFFSVLILFPVLGAAKKKVEFYGDVTVRFEDVSSAEKIDAARHLYGSEISNLTEFNYRGRFGAKARLSEVVGLGARLLFGGTGLPSRSFPSFSSGFQNSDLVLDRVFIALKPSSLTRVWLGKHANPLRFHDGLFWDADVQPTGLSASLSLLQSKWVLTHWYPVTQFRTGAASMYGIQGQYTFDLGASTFETALSYSAAQGVENFLAADAIFAAVNKADVLGDRPQWVDAYLKYRTRLFGRKFSLDGGFLSNVSAGERFTNPDANSYLAGFTFGDARAKRSASWQLRYAYIHKGIASVVNGWTDAGWGADLKGHLIQIEYVPTRELVLSLTHRLYQDADGLDFDGGALPDGESGAYVGNTRLDFSAGF